MSEYNVVKVGSTYLTMDGTALGLPCKTRITNLHLLQLTNIGPIRKAITGHPVKFGLENLKKGIDIRIHSFQFMSDVLDDLVTELDVTPNTTINVTIDGPSGSFDFQVLPGEPAIEYGDETASGRVLEAAINLTVESVNP